MLRRAGFCLLILLLSTKIYAVQAIVSYTIFYIPVQGNTPARPYAEVSWQIDPTSIHYNRDKNGQWSSQLSANIIFSNDTGIVMKDKYNWNTPATDSIHAGSQMLIDLHRYVLPAGNIKMDIILTENGYADPFNFTDSFVIAPPVEQPYYSGLQLLDTAYKYPEENIFSKNGNIQIPLNLNFYNDDRSHIYFYAELYNVSSLGKEEEPLVQYAYISKKMRENPVYGLEIKDTISRKDIIPLMGHFDISTLPSGNYYLNISLIGKSNKALAGNTIFFQRSNKHPLTAANTEKAADTGIEQVNVFDIGSTFAAKFTAPQLKAVMKMLLPISKPTEKEAIRAFQRKPEEMYMRYFIYNFWKERNAKDPKKAWEDYTVNVKEVNKLFGNSALPGYETERGFIYLKYGKPTERVVVENESGALPYEVWQYNSTERQSSQGLFLFYRPGYMVNDYRLLHSTVIGELRNNNWRSTLYIQSANNTGSTNSRAEQYFPAGR